MKPIKARITNALNIGSEVNTCDNSGAKIVRIVAIIGRGKTVKSRNPAAGIADLVRVSIRKGLPTMKGKVFYGVLVRQRKEFRRLSGERIKFADNSIAILKDEKGNPQGTLIKGPVAKEVADRWPNVSKLASVVV